ncbi:hypothetical protein KQX54_008634 [Cotesia glomerata]|uniref:Uncharacterized protein n=1 Tax=Cotesia glomerata TaxID=32391 RepID=A0AAV7I2C8_COTGL|nr:hypothetical protein KQX54_008634 [Cotesia glomerata]
MRSKLIALIALEAKGVKRLKSLVNTAKKFPVDPFCCLEPSWYDPSFKTTFRSEVKRFRQATGIALLYFYDDNSKEDDDDDDGS